ncbi:PLD nuclease N-terminal domain-containing protein [Salinibacterium sp. PAMC 21357]|uniref:PLD nuclease N-terminal domain-containing protein n=1 Tax=Salinibacterium sp. PAMC 21357 TaxID=1112215 RepID=UPI00028903E9|nr:PLD nuclease N-terminal domain-containing protein [Salinibacterium sp. PAMC 21357]
MGSLISLGYFAMLIAVLVDVILIDESRIKNLGKITWVFVVIFLPLIGSILWFAIGREYAPAQPVSSFGAPQRRDALPPLDTSNTEAQLAKLDAEIEFFQNQEKIRELEEKLRNRKQLP